MIDKCLLMSSLITIISVLIYSFMNKNYENNKLSNKTDKNYLFLGLIIFIVSFTICYLSFNSNKSQNISVSDVPISIVNNKPPF